MTRARRTAGREAAPTAPNRQLLCRKGRVINLCRRSAAVGCTLPRSNAHFHCTNRAECACTCTSARPSSDQHQASTVGIATQVELHHNYNAGTLGPPLLHGPPIPSPPFQQAIRTLRTHSSTTANDVRHSLHTPLSRISALRVMQASAAWGPYSRPLPTDR